MCALAAANAASAQHCVFWAYHIPLILKEGKMLYLALFLLSFFAPAHATTATAGSCCKGTCPVAKTSSCCGDCACGCCETGVCIGDCGCSCDCCADGACDCAH
jgi:hypothetical protein